MSATPVNPMQSLFATIGNVIAPDLSATVTDAQQQLQLAFAALMGAQIIIIAELFVIAVVAWKGRK